MSLLEWAKNSINDQSDATKLEFMILARNKSLAKDSASGLDITHPMYKVLAHHILPLKYPKVEWDCCGKDTMLEKEWAMAILEDKDLKHTEYTYDKPRVLCHEVLFETDFGKKSLPLLKKNSVIHKLKEYLDMPFDEMIPIDANLIPEDMYEYMKADWRGQIALALKYADGSVPLSVRQELKAFKETHSPEWDQHKYHPFLMIELLEVL